MVRSLSSTSSKTLDKGRTRGLARVAVAVPSYKEIRNKHKLSANFYFCDNHKLVESRLLCLLHHGSRNPYQDFSWVLERPTVWGYGSGGQNVGFVIWGKSRTRKKTLEKTERYFPHAQGWPSLDAIRKEKPALPYYQYLVRSEGVKAAKMLLKVIIVM